MSKITAIILAAGVGTRFMPMAKAVNKCMLPLGNKPVVQYLVEECVDAGIDNIVIAVPDGEDTIPNHFKPDAELIKLLEKSGKTEAVEQVKHTAALGNKITFCPIVYTDGYGSAIPVREAIKLVPPASSQVLILNGDAVIAHKDSLSGEAKEALLKNKGDQSGILFGFEVDLKTRGRYGVLMQKPEDSELAAQIIEKPSQDVSPQSLNANAAWYLAPRSIEKYLSDMVPDKRSGEYQMTDVINAMIKNHDFVIHKISGLYLDCGTPDVWLASNNHVANMLP